MSGGHILLLAASVLLAVSCTTGDAPNEATTPAQSPLIEKVQRTGSLAVIVTLAIPFTPEGNLPDEQTRQRQRRAISDAQTVLLDELDLRATRRYTHTPQLAMVVDESALRRLLTSPRVASVHEDSEGEP